MVARAIKVRPVLEALVMSAEYKDWGAQKLYSTKAKKYKKLLMSEEFWNRAEQHVVVCDPVMSLLRLADSAQPTIGKIRHRLINLRKHFETVHLSPPSEADAKRASLLKMLTKREKLMDSPLFDAGKKYCRPLEL